MSIRSHVLRVLGDPIDIGQRYHRQLVSGLAIDVGPLGVRVAAIGDHLNTVRPSKPPKRACVIWNLEHAACTQPGRWVYITKNVADRMPSDDALAFIVAHEMAHHDLAHLLGRLATTPATMMVAAVLRGALQAARGHKLEYQADAYAMRLCRAAGYDPTLCLAALELFIDEPVPVQESQTHPPVPDRLARLAAGL
ncbi:MAG: Zn-dependent protease with chaperone function [Kiritimatiellia bacterium]|jgi:Zn-dependent protease with chaperone function